MVDRLKASWDAGMHLETEEVDDIIIQANFGQAESEEGHSPARRRGLQHF